jgi:hypothetical protein
VLVESDACVTWSAVNGVGTSEAPFRIYSLNSVLSNMVYISSGVLFILIVRFRHSFHADANCMVESPTTARGLPPNRHIFYAMGVATALQGMFSAVCVPRKRLCADAVMFSAVCFPRKRLCVGARDVLRSVRSQETFVCWCKGCSPQCAFPGNVSWFTVYVPRKRFCADSGMFSAVSVPRKRFVMLVQGMSWVMHVQGVSSMRSRMSFFFGMCAVA